MTVVFGISPIDDARLGADDVHIGFLLIMKLFNHGLDALISPIIVRVDNNRIEVALIDIDKGRR